MLKPILKYNGGKSREIPLFEKYIPSTFDTYFEPFLGGGAVYFYLEPKKAVLNDVNARLINFYEDVKSNFRLLSMQVNFLSSIYSKTYLFIQAEERENSDNSDKTFQIC